MPRPAQRARCWRPRKRCPRRPPGAAPHRIPPPGGGRVYRRELGPRRLPLPGAGGLGGAPRAQRGVGLGADDGDGHVRRRAGAVRSRGRGADDDGARPRRRRGRGRRGAARRRRGAQQQWQRRPRPARVRRLYQRRGPIPRQHAPGRVWGRRQRGEQRAPRLQRGGWWAWGALAQAAPTLPTPPPLCRCTPRSSSGTSSAPSRAMHPCPSSSTPPRLCGTRAS